MNFQLNIFGFTISISRNNQSESWDNYRSPYPRGWNYDFWLTHKGGKTKKKLHQCVVAPLTPTSHNPLTMKTFVPNPHLEMLMSREQLMIDIDCIVESELDGIISQELSDELVRRLCDAVCNHFPAS